MIEPHGGRLVDRVINEQHAAQIRKNIDSDSTIELNWNQYQDVLNLATGRFSPLEGFLSRNDFKKVLHDQTLDDGTTWPLPVTLDVSSDLAQRLSPGEMAKLESPKGEFIGTIKVAEIYKYNQEYTTKQVFGTSDPSHPGVRNYIELEPFFVGGPIFLFEEHRYNRFDLFPIESRVLFDHRGWDTIVGFQTRNAPHRAHEYIQRTSLEHVDGLLIQPKLGDKKVDDYRDEVIMGAYEILVDNYYRTGRLATSVFPNKMNYAGPREAIFDALVRKNQGCTHFVVGRDHAGVGDYYGDFDAHKMFKTVGDVGIEIVFYDYSFYCNVCDGMTSEKICPHEDEVRIHPSGTKIRQQIRDRTHPSEKIMRPEVADYIIKQDNPFVTEQSNGGG